TFGVAKDAGTGTQVSVSGVVRVPTIRNDVNADGASDLLWQNNDGVPAIWEMNGTSIVGGGMLTSPGPFWQLKASGDFNGDGADDIVWQNNDGLPLIWEMVGAVAVSSATLPNPGPSWHVIAAADFNADGKADILWQNTDGAAAIWEMNGTSIIAGGVLINPGSSWHVIGASDFNGDGKADIIWQNTDGTPAIWEMNGTSIIGGGVLPNPGSAWKVKDDGPISLDPTGADLQPPVLHLSTPDAANLVPVRSAPDAGTTWPTGFAGPAFAPQSAPPLAATGFINPNYGEPIWPQLHPGNS